MKEAKKVQITEQICRQAQLMRKGGANQAQVAELLGINNSTVSRIEAAGFDFKTYTEQRKARREKEEARKRQAEEQPAEEKVQVPGQIEMDLTPVEKQEISDQTKMMRFQAHQVDKICERITQNNLKACEKWEELGYKVDSMRDMLGQLLRIIRRE